VPGPVRRGKKRLLLGESEGEMKRLVHIITNKRTGLVHRCTDFYCWRPACIPEDFYSPDLARWETSYVESLEGLRLCKRCWEG